MHVPCCPLAGPACGIWTQDRIESVLLYVSIVPSNSIGNASSSPSFPKPGHETRDDWGHEKFLHIDAADLPTIEICVTRVMS